MALPDLISLEAVKSWLGLTDPAQDEDDALLSGLISAASAFVRAYCRRDFTAGDYVECFDGRGGRRLTPGQTPLTAIASLEVDGRPVPPCPQPGAAGYSFDAHAVTLHGQTFSWGLCNVTLAYSAGYAELPADLQQACVALVAAWFRGRERIGVSSRVLAGETVSFTGQAVPPEVAAVLDRHARVVPR